MENNKGKALLLKELAQFQQTITGAKKGAKNPFFKTTYADLESVVNAIRAGCEGLNLGFYHSIENAVLSTVLFYSDGENYAELTSSMSVDVQINGKNPMQDMGSAITYAKRYTLQSLFGLPSEDDDGNSLQGVKVKQQPDKPQKYTLNMLSKHISYIEGKYFVGNNKPFDPVMISQIILEDLKAKPYLVDDQEVINAISQLCIELAEKKNKSIEQVLDDELPV